MSVSRTLPEWLGHLPQETALLDAPGRRRAADAALDRGFPGRRDDSWRYTKLADLDSASFVLQGHDARPSAAQLTALTPEGVALDRVVIINGRLAPELCDIGSLPEGAGFGSLSGMARAAREGVVGAAAILERLDQLSRPGDRTFSAMNSALAHDGVGLFVPDGARMERPLLVISMVLAGVETLLVQPRLLVVAGKESRATIIESHGGFGDQPYLCNAVSEFDIGEGARVEHIRVQRDSVAGRRVSGAFMRLASGAQLRSHTFTTSGSIVRNEFQMDLAGAHAEGEINALSLLRGRTHVDNNTLVRHLVPDCRSHQTFRTTLADGSRGIFTGRIFVAPDAQRTDAFQSCASMLLSPEARALARPQLEILADDVKCTHGATVGSLDPSSLFYLRSRGIPRDLAKRILIHAFCSGLLGRVRTGEMLNPLDRLITRTLAG